MIEQSMLQWIISQTGLAGVAALALWIMRLWHEESARRRDEAHKRELQRADESLAREKANAEVHRDDKKTLLDVVRANTESNIRLIETIRNIQEPERMRSGMRGQGND